MVNSFRRSTIAPVFSLSSFFLIVCVCVCVCVLLLTWLTNERVDESMKAHYSFTLMSFESRHWGSEQTLKGGRNDDDDDAADDNDD